MKEYVYSIFQMIFGLNKYIHRNSHIRVNCLKIQYNFICAKYVYSTFYIIFYTNKHKKIILSGCNRNL